MPRLISGAGLSEAPAAASACAKAAGVPSAAAAPGSGSTGVCWGRALAVEHGRHRDRRLAPEHGWHPDRKLAPSTINRMTRTERSAIGDAFLLHGGFRRQPPDVSSS
ncbi:MAG TPA: hypothetical protein VFI42_01245 [Thermomicrobiaceae bacterium]|nr:hypothetical protein [Thermomicrobiaceae bacterium]